MIWNKPKLLATVTRCSAGMVENPPTIYVYAVKFTMIKRKKYIKVFLEKERQFDLSDATVHPVHHALPDGAAPLRPICYARLFIYFSTIYRTVEK